MAASEVAPHLGAQGTLRDPASPINATVEARHRSRPRAVPAIVVLAILTLAGCSGAASSASAPPIAAAGSASASPPAVPSTASTSGGQTPSPVSASAPTPTPSPAPLSLTSSAFAANGPIPAEYTCRGADRSPALAWTGVPADAAALVLFVDDPDGRDWVHWSALDLPPTTTGLPEGVPPAADPPQQGTNDFGKVGYGGPCPPSGTHHYRFTLYALAAPLGLPGHPDGRAVRTALGNADVLGQVTLVGTFAK